MQKKIVITILLLGSLYSLLAQYSLNGISLNNPSYYPHPRLIVAYSDFNLIRIKRTDGLKSNFRFKDQGYPDNVIRKSLKVSSNAILGTKYVQSRSGYCAMQTTADSLSDNFFIDVFKGCNKQPLNTYHSLDTLLISSINTILGNVKPYVESYRHFTATFLSIENILPIGNNGFNKVCRVFVASSNNMRLAHAEEAVPLYPEVGAVPSFACFNIQASIESAAFTNCDGFLHNSDKLI